MNPMDNKVSEDKITILIQPFKMKSEQVKRFFVILYQPLPKESGWKHKFAIVAYGPFDTIEEAVNNQNKLIQEMKNG